MIPTTLAFVQLDSKGDRSFTFYRNPGADVMLTSAEVNRNLIDDAAIFHFGSVSLTSEPKPHRHVGSCAVCTAAGQAGQL